MPASASTSSLPRLALVGLGNMGKNHLRSILGSADFKLCAIVDPFLKTRPEGVSNEVQILANVEDLAPMSLDAAIVASPTQTHYTIVKQLLEFGLHILVEKPAASTYAQCLELTALAKEKNLYLCVGNIERCNPAVSEMKKVLDSALVGQPVHFDATRAGGYPREVKEGNHVVLDLAVHEFDVLNLLLGHLDVHSSMCRSKRGNGIFDVAEIQLRGRNSISVSIHVNWLSTVRIRSLKITCTEGICVLDYIKQSCLVYGHNIISRIPLGWNIQSYSDESNFYERIEFKVEKQEPLRVQLNQFYELIQGREHYLCWSDEISESVWVAEQCVNKSEEAFLLGTNAEAMQRT